MFDLEQVVRLANKDVYGDELIPIRYENGDEVFGADLLDFVEFCKPDHEDMLIYIFKIIGQDKPNMRKQLVEYLHGYAEIYQNKQSA